MREQSVGQSVDLTVVRQNILRLSVNMPVEQHLEHSNVLSARQLQSEKKSGCSVAARHTT